MLNIDIRRYSRFYYSTNQNIKWATYLAGTILGVKFQNGERLLFDLKDIKMVRPRLINLIEKCYMGGEWFYSFRDDKGCLIWGDFSAEDCDFYVDVHGSNVYSIALKYNSNTIHLYKKLFSMAKVGEWNKKKHSKISFNAVMWISPDQNDEYSDIPHVYIEHMNMKIPFSIATGKCLVPNGSGWGDYIERRIKEWIEAKRVLARQLWNIEYPSKTVDIYTGDTIENNGWCVSAGVRRLIFALGQEKITLEDTEEGWA